MKNPGPQHHNTLRMPLGRTIQLAWVCCGQCTCRCSCVLPRGVCVRHGGLPWCDGQLARLQGTFTVDVEVTASSAAWYRMNTATGVSRLLGDIFVLATGVGHVVSAWLAIRRRSALLKRVVSPWPCRPPCLACSLSAHAMLHDDTYYSAVSDLHCTWVDTAQSCLCPV